MAATPCHVAYLRLMPIDATGKAIVKEAATTTLGTMMKAGNTELRVIPDPNIPNSANYPSIHDYITAEAGGGFTIGFMNNTLIVTYG